MFLRLDGELESFIEQYINTFIKWDLVVFFHNNPELKETKTGISKLLGRSETDIGTTLDELAASKLLLKKKSGSEDSYSYAPTPEKKEIIERFVSCLDSREKRLLILTKLLRLEANR